MQLLEHAAVIIATLAVLITFHEYGHFIVARWCKVKVLRFCIGFGPVLWRTVDKKGTEFAVAALPLGGYVKMLDEREAPVEEAEKPLAFNQKTVWQRIAIASAGPLANFLLAILIYWLIFLHGTTGISPKLFNITPDSIAAQAGLQAASTIVAVDNQTTSTINEVLKALSQRLGETGVIQISTRQQGSDVIEQHDLVIHQWLSDADNQVDLLGSLGLGFYQPKLDAIVDKVLPQSAAEKAGLQSGDKILQADQQAISDWQQWVDYVQSHAGQAVALSVLRQGQTLALSITPESVQHDGKTIGRAGVSALLPALPEDLLVKTHYNVFSAWLPALQNTWQMSLFSLESLKKMLLGQLSYKQLSGPISIAKYVTESTAYGFYSYLTLLALLSVSLAVLNLLPIPVLDGGHIVLCLIEWLNGKPLSERIQTFAFQIGSVIVLSVMLLAVFNDLGRL